MRSVSLNAQASWGGAFELLRMAPLSRAGRARTGAARRPIRGTLIGGHRGRGQLSGHGRRVAVSARPRSCAGLKMVMRSGHSAEHVEAGPGCGRGVDADVSWIVSSEPGVWRVAGVFFFFCATMTGGPAAEKIARHVDLAEPQVLGPGRRRRGVACGVTRTAGGLSSEHASAGVGFAQSVFRRLDGQLVLAWQRRGPAKPARHDLTWAARAPAG